VGKTTCKPLSEWQQVLWHLDEPRWGYNLYLNWNLLRMAHASGIRVMLDGFDGDTTLSHGEGLTLEWAKTGHWLFLMNEMRAHFRLRGDNDFLPLYLKFIWRNGIRPRLSSRSLHFLKWITRNKNRKTNTQFFPLFRKEFSERIQLSGRIRSESVTFPNQRICHKQKIKSCIMHYILELLDSTSSAFSIESHYPFWDRELIEFCLALPSKFILHRGYSRVIMRDSMNGILSNKVRLRPDKSQLNFGFERNMMHYNRQEVVDYIENRDVEFDGRLNQQAIRELCLKFLNGNCSNDEYMLIWRLVTLNMWRQIAKEKAPRNKKE
jgi:asparagine synthase (glutamine-hydrolysing)